MDTKNKESFTFDYIAKEDTEQQAVFDNVGRQIVNQCLLGYNGSIFAYGQTGSGKTFTIQGGEKQDQSRGILPRCFEFLFAEMAKIKNKHMLAQRSDARASGSIGGGASAGKSLYNQAMFKDERVVDIQFDIKCSYIEIYNETIFDLLDSVGKSKL